MLRRGGGGGGEGKEKEKGRGREGEGEEEGRRREGWKGGGRRGRGDYSADNHNQHGKKTLGAEVLQLGSRAQASVPYVYTLCLPIVCLLTTRVQLFVYS